MNVTSGSIALNRFSIQIHEALYLIIANYEIYNNFIIIMDYWDDISFFDSELCDQNVQHYQIKTEETTNLNEYIKDKVFRKMYSHFIDNYNGFVKQYSANVKNVYFVTNQYLTFNRKKILKEDSKTFKDLSQEVQDRLQEHLHDVFDNEFDIKNLEKFVFTKSILSNEAYEMITSQLFIDFLMKSNKSILNYTCNIIYNSVTKYLFQKSKSKKEKEANLEKIIKDKGITKKEFDEMVKYTTFLSFYDQEEIIKIGVKYNIDELKLRRAFSFVSVEINELSESLKKLYNLMIDYFISKYKNTALSDINLFINEIKEQAKSNYHIDANDYVCEVLAITLFYKEHN